MDWQDAVKDILFKEGANRLRLTVKGRVQGVGFRPAVYRFAGGAGLSGFVMNTRRGVIIEIEGEASSINRFGLDLTGRMPPLARIDSIAAEAVEVAGSSRFVIEGSEPPGDADALFPVDTCVCGDCLAEMNDPTDPRYRYPFINCTNCGPRFTIIEDLPYDRKLTTMKEFRMDGLCSSQYADPSDRRFHAEPISCPGCGPRLNLLDAGGAGMTGDPIEETKKLLAGGKIVAVKGLGGYHLSCLAADGAAVARLRERKKRPAKPFALMFRDMAGVERCCLVSKEERELLLSPESPIVLLRRKGDGLPDEIAPDNAYLGIFLPYTPVHHLLMEEFEALVMTSANFTDEPLVSLEEELPSILGPIADAALVNDRRIAHKCDDSIFFVPAGMPVPVRRARGFVPEPVNISKALPACILGTGAQEKGTFALTRGDRIFVSPHLGDLGDFRSQQNYRDELEDFERMLGVSPEVAVHDLHPDYFTTRFAASSGISSRIAVQHHHAHAVSVMAEHGLFDPVMAVSFDGTGYGSDGRLWGGEFLVATRHDFERVAHLKYVPLPGGAAAVREPWRMALMHIRNLSPAALNDLPRSLSFGGFPAGEILVLADKGINSIETSSVGRLFDAVAFMLGCGGKVSYEAQAAVSLEKLAMEAGEAGRGYSFDYEEGVMTLIEPAPVIEAVLEDLSAGVDRACISAAFHNAVASLITELSVKLAKRYGCRGIVLSGGVFQNRFLYEKVIVLSRRLPIPVYHHIIVPPNDGGVSLGQAAAGGAIIEKG